MRVADRDDRTIMEAVKASNNGQHGRAAALWRAAEKARKIRDSD